MARVDDLAPCTLFRKTIHRRPRIDARYAANNSFNYMHLAGRLIAGCCEASLTSQKPSQINNRDSSCIIGRARLSIVCRADDQGPNNRSLAQRRAVVR